MSLLFVGEKPSLLAYRKGYTWASQKLAGRTLSDALDSLQVPSGERKFLNLFGDHPDAEEKEGEETQKRLKKIKRAQSKHQIVGMGGKVCRVLERNGISHLAIVHPAARGRIRKKERYIAHVVEVLSSYKGASVQV